MSNQIEREQEAMFAILDMERLADNIKLNPEAYRSVSAAISFAAAQVAFAACLAASTNPSCREH